MNFSVFEQSQNFSMAENNLSPMESDFTPAQEEPNAYHTAASFAWFADFYFNAMAGFPQAYFQQNQWGDPSLEGNTWVWEYNWSHQGESLTMRVTAEEVGPATHWELRYSYSGSEESVDNALLIAAQMDNDGEQGAWQMYNFDENEEIFNISYEMDEGVTTLVDMDISQNNDARVLYQRDRTESMLEVWDSGEYTLMQWNNETGTGFIESPQYQDGQPVCWNASFENTSC